MAIISMLVFLAGVSMLILLTSAAVLVFLTGMFWCVDADLVHLDSAIY